MILGRRFWPDFLRNRLHKNKDSYQYKSGSIKARYKRKGLLTWVAHKHLCLSSFILTVERAYGNENRGGRRFIDCLHSGGGVVVGFLRGGRKKVHASEQAKITLAMDKIAKVNDSIKLLMGPKRK